METIMMKKKKKTSKGRQKAVMKKIEKKTALQTTFSKRRHGLFNKAGELSILTGADVAVIVKSPGDKVFSFGSPSPDYVIGRLFPQIQNQGDVTIGKNGKQPEIVQNSSSADGRFWWEEDVSGLGLDDLEIYIAALEELQRKVMARTNDLAALERVNMATN